MEKRLPISSIEVKDRHRKFFGDLKGLAHSIKTVGLLQSIGVTKEDRRLVFGDRRLRACKLNGDTEIDCRILDIDNIMQAEHAENEFRESLTLSEKHALAEEMKPKMPKRKGGDRQSDKSKKQCGHPGHTALKGTTRTHVAAKAGFSSEQEMRRVARVMERGVPELIEAMDRDQIPVSTAAALVTKPKKQQLAYLEEHRGQNGRVRSEGLQKSQAQMFTERMDEIIARCLGIENQYGSVAEMFKSPLWASSTPAQKKACIQRTVEAAQNLAVIAKAMVSYKKKNIK